MENNRVIKITFKEQYGNVRIFPMNDTAEIFTKLMGKKTLDQKDIELIRTLGFEVEEVSAYSLSQIKKGA